LLEYSEKRSNKLSVQDNVSIIVMVIWH